MKCPDCFPVTAGTSAEESDLANFIKDRTKCKILLNDRTLIFPYELDIYIPEKNLAFEFDGLYWHSAEHKDKNYHLMKSAMCSEKNVQLIHIFENDWIYRNDIVKSRIENLLNINESRIFARKCQIREINGKTAYDFYEKNHI